MDIVIDADSLAQLLDENNKKEDHEYKADFYWNDGTTKDTIKNVGFRLRGNTSRASAKKSFKIKFNYFDGKKFHGLSDLNLNGEHNDPSIIRSKINWDLMKMAGIEGARSNHVVLYINGEYRGLYINVEHIDNDYFQARKKNGDGQLFKCFFGADLKYLGNNANSYLKNVYTPENNQENPDYQHFMQFLKILNNDADADYECKLEEVFDVNAYLRNMAFEVLIGHWDNLLFNKNNAYLYYNTDTKKMEYIPYDVDNTYGIDWFGIDWSQRNIYSWTNTFEPRPLYTKLLGHPAFKQRFGYYIKTFLDQYFNLPFLKPYIEKIKTRIAPYVVNDKYATYDYGYDYADFLSSYNEGTGDHVPLGIYEYIQLRSSSALTQLQNIAIAPFFESNTVQWQSNNIGTSFYLTSQSETSVTMHYRFDGGNWVEVAVKDDGNGADKIAGDHKYSTSLAYTTQKNFEYYYTATDVQGKKTTWPECYYFSTTLGYEETPPLYINEFMADNTSIEDDAGELEDWIEIYNAGPYQIYLGDYYLTDSKDNVKKWPFPPLDIESHEYLVFWADEDKSQGYLHANFKLSKSGEFLGIYDGEANNYAPIDTFTFGNCEANKSYGRYPDAAQGIQKLPSLTPGYSNVVTGTHNGIENKPSLFFPNPVYDKIYFKQIEQIEKILFYDLSGKLIFQTGQEGIKGNSIDVAFLVKGCYFLKVVSQEGIKVNGLIKI